MTKAQSAVFIGSTSFLLECVNVWREIGFIDDAVISEDAEVKVFCKKKYFLL
tara:strand:+ start:147 stop:302 length:156 start_codon:yes stop_codon:yes gene_type:complete